MKTLAIVILIIGFAVLGISHLMTLTETLDKEESENITDVSTKTVKIIILDGCEYFVYKKVDGYEAYFGLTHKGNCKNCE